MSGLGQLVLGASAVLWPLAAGVTVVLWSKGRAVRMARRKAAVDAGLQGLFQTLESTPAPPHLHGVIDALAEQERDAAAGARPARKRKPATSSS